ncbi:MAG: hypothetical protein KDA89_09345 [Planctomycetaceae bacterium]|nr:hypothetical protein [Planctomycetaceae bacterium]
MYAFRKPFTAAAYADSEFAGVGFKTILVTSQVFGYLLSKILGVKIISEMAPERRAAVLAKLILAAEAALVLFAVMPRPWNAVCLFLNGLPLGMVFGLVLGFLEGRRMTEALTAGLCVSFILADGAAKSVGTLLLNNGVTEEWMPCLTGLLFLLPMFVCIEMLRRVPSPTVRDVAARAERSRMDRGDRNRFLKRYAPGLSALILVYLLVTILRSIRADFAPEIWKSLGTAATPELFSLSEMCVAVVILAVNGASVLIPDNRRAFQVSLLVCTSGLLLLPTSLLLLRSETVASFGFMVLLGLGLYLPYVAMHTTVFERLLAVTRERANLGFLMYVADSVGYLGYVAVMVLRNFVSAETNVLTLLMSSAWLTTALSLISLAFAAVYFRSRTAVENTG